MCKINDEVVKFFLENQGKSFDEPVANNMEEAYEFLEDCMAVVFNDIISLKKYWEEEGVDMEGMTNDEILDSYEVFSLPDGKILLVEA